MSALTESMFSDTLESLYAATTDESQWSVAMARLSQAFDVPRVALLRATPRLDGLLEIRHINHDPAAERLYNDYYFAYDPSHRITRDAVVGCWLDRPDLFDPETTPEPEYMDFAVRNGIRFVAGGKVHSDATSVTLLGLQRPRDHKAFDCASAETFRRLSQHIGRAAALSTELRAAQLAKGLSLAAIDSLEWAVFAVDAGGKLLLANRPGERALILQTPFALRGTRLVARDAEADLRLRSGLAAASKRRASTFACPCAGAQWMVRIVPTTSFPGAALVYVSDARASDTATVPAGMFGFTPAEADIANLVAEGLGAKQIARERNVSENTIRTHIKHVFEKTGARRMSELAKLLLAVPKVRDDS
jgi:DNA-binding CsgD family transcriptional regulator